MCIFYEEVQLSLLAECLLYQKRRDVPYTLSCNQEPLFFCKEE